MSRRRRSLRPNFAAFVGIPGLIFVLLAFGSALIAILRFSLSEPSFGNYSQAFGSTLFRSALVNTAEMAVVVTLLCLLVSYPYAYCMVYAGRAVRIVLIAALLISFWTSLLVRTYSWQIILNDTGLINELLQTLGVTDSPLRLARTKLAVYVGMIHILAPLCTLAIYANMRSLGPDLLMAARGMGASPWRAFVRVTLPLTAPGAFAGSTLVLILALGFYITPQILGGSGQVYVGNAIVIQLEQLYRPGVAAAMSVVLLVAVLIILGVVGRFVGVGRILGVNREGVRK